MIFRGKDGSPGCVQNTCAHRACPLHLGSVNEGRITCPYHGWEYSTDGKCEKMPSTKLQNVKIKSLPCLEQDGMIWIWPGDETPTDSIPSLQPPSGFRIHAEVNLYPTFQMLSLITETLIKAKLVEFAKISRE